MRYLFSCLFLLFALNARADDAATMALLRDAGQQIETMFSDFVDVSMAEDLNELTYHADALAWTARHGQFRYNVEVPLRETRNGKRPQGFIFTGGFMTVLRSFATSGQKDYSFRVTGPERVEFEGKSAKGRIWLNAARRTIRRIEFIASATTDVEYDSVRFDSVDRTEILPRSAVFTAHAGEVQFQSVHRFSDYHLYGIDDADDPAQRAKNSGVGAGDPARPEDAVEAMARGDEAGLRRAAELAPERPDVHFQLGVLSWKNGKPAEAETELRKAAALAPNAVPVHDLLASVLYARGDFAGAIEELRASVALDPAKAQVHFALGTALEKSGNAAGALEEYRLAASLAPDTKEYTDRFEARSQPVVDATIRVDVKQVLVPVVVTRDGHYVSGLTRDDFHVFEDGVEQKIVSFRAESSGLGPARDAATAVATVSRQPAQRVQRTYMICIDTAHAAFGSLVYVRDALLKLFRKEDEGESQYVLITLGQTSTVLRNTTRHPADVIAAIDGAQLQKAFGGSRRASSEQDLLEFRRQLTRVRNACDHQFDDMPDKAECQSGLVILPQMASRIAEQERAASVSFLRQLRFMVQQLGKGTDRRTLVLVSDGWDMFPGRTPYVLMSAYFTELHSFELSGYERITGELEPIIRLAQQNDIRIYTIDSRGLYASPLYMGSDPGGIGRLLPAVGQVLDNIQRSAGDTLQQIAQETGGTAFQNSNDLLAGLERAFADGRDYYLLSYVSSNPSDEKKFRGITVALADKKLRVSAKAGY